MKVFARPDFTKGTTRINFAYDDKGDFPKFYKQFESKVTFKMDRIGVSYEPIPNGTYVTESRGGGDKVESKKFSKFSPAVANN